jgi:thiol-disulfide isomerase/thioredoxin
MSDFAKFILVVCLMVGGWFVMDYRKQQTRKFGSEAGQKLVMIQGTRPSDGKPVVLEFWGTYCGPCVHGIPHLNQLYAKYGGRAQFIAVSSEPAATVRQFMARTAMSYPVAVDPSHEFFSGWKIDGVPTLIFLDANHREQWRGHAMEMTDEKLSSLLGAR